MPWQPVCSHRHGRERMHWLHIPLPLLPWLHGWVATCMGITQVTFLKSLLKHQVCLPAEVKCRELRQESLQLCANFYPSTPIPASHPSSKPAAPTVFAIIKLSRRQQGTAATSCYILPHPRFGVGSSLHPLHLLLSSLGLFGNQALPAAHGTTRALAWQ